MEGEEWCVKLQAGGELEKWVGLLEGIGLSLEAFWLEGGFWWWGTFRKWDSCYKLQDQKVAWLEGR